MGIATYSAGKDMPDDLRKALPDIDDLKALQESGDEDEETSCLLVGIQLTKKLEEQAPKNAACRRMIAISAEYAEHL